MREIEHLIQMAVPAEISSFISAGVTISTLSLVNVRFDDFF